MSSGVSEPLVSNANGDEEGLQLDGRVETLPTPFSIYNLLSNYQGSLKILTLTGMYSP